MFKYPWEFQRDNELEFKSDVTKMVKKHNEGIRGTAKYKHPHTAFVEAFKKELAKLLFKPWMLKSFMTLKKYQQFGLRT